MKKLSRHHRRILLIQALYMWENYIINNRTLPSELLEILKYVWETDTNGVKANLEDFDTSRFKGAIEKIEELKEIIGKLAPEWPLNKIAAIDRAILYLSLYELKYTDVPVPVVINEAVELAKDFANPRSPQFINGVLSSYIKQ